MRATAEKAWPALPLGEWLDTYATLHMWTQIVGKVRLALSPHLNHWWEVPLYVNAHGLTTSAIPYQQEIFEIEFDFIEHKLEVVTGWGQAATIALAPRSVADFYAEFMGLLQALGIQVRIWPMPVEVPNPIRFDQDRIHATYDAEYAHRFWRILKAADMVLKEFRAGFIGKSSPVHFFWGSFDLAVSRFSGRRAPPRPGADSITREAYSHEVSSCGFWAGSEAMPYPVFYAYAYPEPPGYADRRLRPAEAHYDGVFREFILPYEAVRQSPAPDETVLAFLQDSYEAAADLGRWDRTALESSRGPTR